MHRRRGDRRARGHASSPSAPRCVADQADAIPALLGLSFGVLLTSLGGSSILSALVVYPVQLPGESPFQTKQGASTASVVSQLVGWLAVMALCLPEMILALLAVRGGSVALGWVTLVVGLGARLGAARVGVRIGGRDARPHGPGLLSKIVAFA